MKICSIQDVSCYGQCSLTVALPVLSACGIETAILPTAILSTHTSGFQGFTFLDLKDELPRIEEHWKKEGLCFDAVYTGYLGNTQDVEVALSIAKGSLNKGPLIIDPAFGDGGKLYPGFDDAYVEGMIEFARHADVLLPNLTEACALLKRPYVAKPSKEEVDEILKGLHSLGIKTVILKGIGNTEENTGIVVSDGASVSSYAHPRIAKDFHGTGDVFASAFVGAYLHGKPALEAGKIAADFTLECIQNTLDDPAHAYGVKFEPLLHALYERVMK